MLKVDPHVIVTTENRDPYGGNQSQCPWTGHRHFQPLTKAKTLGYKVKTLSKSKNITNHIIFQTHNFLKQGNKTQAMGHCYKVCVCTQQEGTTKCKVHQCPLHSLLHCHPHLLAWRPHHPFPTENMTVTTYQGPLGTKEW